MILIQVFLLYNRIQMLKRLLLICLTPALFGVITTSGQSISPSVINSSGNSFQTSYGGMDVNIGEQFTGHFDSGSYQASEGFLQPSYYFINLKLFLEGYYIGGSKMQPVIQNQTGIPSIHSTDTICIEVHDEGNPSLIVESRKAILTTNGMTSLYFNRPFEGKAYWVSISHRNTIESWTSFPIQLNSTKAIAYDFTNSASSVYGSNSVDVFNENIWSLHTGDLNQDGFIDIFDFPFFDYDFQYFTSAFYTPSDLNGNGLVDIFDFPYYDANNQQFISTIHP